MKPDQIITLMTFDGADNTLAMADHYDHIHVGWKPLYGTNSKAAKQVNAVLKPKQWIKLIDRLEQIDNPTVALQPSKHALKVTERASEAHTRRVEGAAASRRFSFVQWEFAGRLGPEAGRYVVRRFAGDDPRHVVVIGELEAPRRRRLGAPAAPRAGGARAGAGRGRRHARDRDRDRSDHRREARTAGWRRPCASASRPSARRWRCSTARSTAHRLAAADPYVREVSAAMALATRIGYGSGEQVADGDWEEARELPPPERQGARCCWRRSSGWRRCCRAATSRWRARSSRCARGSTSTRAAAREAALQLSLALEAALAELEGWRASAAVATRLDELRGAPRGVAAGGRGRAARAGCSPSRRRRSRRRWGGSRRRCGARWRSCERGRASRQPPGGTTGADASAVDEYLAGLLRPADPGLDDALARQRGGRAARARRRAAPGRAARAAGADRGRAPMLEIGTLGGYSTIWLARALPPAARSSRSRSTPHYAEVARANLDRAGVGERVEVLVGPGARRAARARRARSTSCSSTPTSSTAPTTSRWRCACRGRAR